MSNAQEITRKAKSNLAVTLACLPKDRKRDMISFYAFCRIIDDLADDLDAPREQRAAGLQAWRNGMEHGFDDPDELQSEITELITRYKIPNSLFIDLIDGCASDLDPQRFSTWDDLQQYTYRVACCVGLISIRIFGCTHTDSEKYAVALGHALQITNILRDVHEDLEKENRVYLPLDVLARYDYSEDDLKNKRHDNSFVALMTDLADRAESYYQEALNHRQPQDAKALRSAEAMRKIYHALLKKMRAGNFQVFKKRYSVSKAKKAAILLGTMIP